MAIQTIKKLEDYVLTNPAGLQGEIQFNNGGSFDTNSTFVYDTSTNRVGIGVSSPNEKLVVAGAIRSTSNAVDWAASDGSIIDYLNGDTRIVAARNGANSSNILFTTYNAGVAGERVRIDPLGNVGIGVNPQARLHVAGDNDTEVIRVGGDGDAGGVQGSAYIGISHWKPTSAQTYSPIRIGAKEIGIADYRADLVFETRDVNSDSAPVERMRIDSSGNVGIGVEPALTKMLIADASPTTLQLWNTAGGVSPQSRIALGALSSNYPQYRGVYFMAEYNGDGHDAIISTSPSNALSPTEKIRITSAGNVGIGTDNPGTTLDVQGGNVRIDGGSVTDRQLYFRNQSTGTVGGSVRSDQTLSLFAGVGGAPTQAVTIERETLNVGIGIDNPYSTLTIQGNNYVKTNSGIAVDGIALGGGSTGEGGYTNGLSVGFGGGSAAISGIQLTNDADAIGLSFFTHPSGTGANDSIEMMRLNGTGLAIGTNLNASTPLHIETTASNHITMLRALDVTNSASEQIGVIRGGAIDSSGNPEIGASIGLGIYDADGAGAGTDFGGSIIFNTRTEGGSSPTEKMRINNDGAIERSPLQGSGYSYEFLYGEVTTTDLSVDITLDTDPNFWHPITIEATVSYVNNQTPQGTATFLIFFDCLNGTINHQGDAVQASVGTIPTLSVSVSSGGAGLQETITLTFNTWDGAAVAHRSIGHFRVLTTYENGSRITHS